MSSTGSVISEEIQWQLKEKEGREKPDYVVACVGGGVYGTFICPEVCGLRFPVWRG